MKADCGLEEMHQLRDQLKPFFAYQIGNAGQIRLKRQPAVARFKDHAVIVARLNAATCIQRDAEVHRRRAGMKQVQRPNINRPARQINPRRRNGLDKHNDER